MISLENEDLKVGINLDGGELNSINFNGVNILWDKSSLWQEHSPILFPNIGHLKDNYYLYKNIKYNSSAHGFAKKERFKVLKQDKDLLILSLESNEETLKVYPFKFRLEVKYQLIDKSLNIIFKVFNLGDYDMYFSLGFHPGFSYKGLNKLLENTMLNIENKKYLSIDFNKEYISGSHVEKLGPISFSDFSKKLVEPRTLCYKDMNVIDLAGKKSSIRIKHDMPYTAFWQMKPETNKDFLCIESWAGLPDFVDSKYELDSKNNLVKLEKKSIFETYYNISLIEN